MSRNNLLEMVMHFVNTEEQCLYKIMSFNDEIALLKYEKESLQDGCTQHYSKCNSFQNFMMNENWNDSTKEAETPKNKL